MENILAQQLVSATTTILLHYLCWLMNIARYEFKFSCSNARLWLHYWEKVRAWTSTLVIAKNIQKGRERWFARSVIGICQLHGSKCPFRGRSRNRNLLHITLEWIIIFFSRAVRDDGEDLSSLLWSSRKPHKIRVVDRAYLVSIPTDVILLIRNLLLSFFSPR